MNDITYEYIFWFNVQSLRLWNLYILSFLLIIAEKNKNPNDNDIIIGCQLKTFSSQSTPPKYFLEVSVFKHQLKVKPI